MQRVIVIHEMNKDDNDTTVIGVASSREKALEIIKEYYGEQVMTDFRDVRENNIDFACRVTVEGKLGGKYDVIGEDFVIDSL